MEWRTLRGTVHISEVEASPRYDDLRDANLQRAYDWTALAPIPGGMAIGSLYIILVPYPWRLLGFFFFGATLLSYMLEFRQDEPVDPREGEPYVPSARRDLKNSGARQLLFYALLIFGVGFVAFDLGAISYDVLIALFAIALALSLDAGVELRFYQVKMQMRNIERMLKDLKDRRA